MGELIKRDDVSFPLEDDFVWQFSPDHYTIMVIRLPLSRRFDFKMWVESTCDDVYYFLDDYGEGVVFLKNEEATAFALTFQDLHEETVAYRQYLEDNY